MRWPPKPVRGPRALEQVEAIALGKMAGYRMRALLAEYDLREAEARLERWRAWAFEHGHEEP